MSSKEKDPMVSSSSTFSLVVGTSVTFALLACTSVGLRLYARVRIIKLPKHDDAALILALMGMLAYNVFLCSQLPYGLGVPVQDVPPQDLSKLLMYLWASIICYAVSLAAVKTSILLQFLRFLVGRRVRAFCWLMVGVSACYGVVGILVTVFLCLPVSGFWDPAGPGPIGRCLSRHDVWLAHSGLNIATDVVIFVTPVPTVLRLNMDMRQKLAVMAIFCVGIIVCVISMLRLDSVLALANTNDVTYDNVPVSLWSNAELTTAILCATVSGIKPLVQWFSARRSGSSQESYGAPSKPPGGVSSGSGCHHHQQRPVAAAHDGGYGLSTREAKKGWPQGYAVDSDIELTCPGVEAVYDRP